MKRYYAPSGPQDPEQRQRARELERLLYLCARQYTPKQLAEERMPWPEQFGIKPEDAFRRRGQ